MSNHQQVLQQVLSDPYRSQSDKDAARAQLDQLSGIIRERSELDKNANGLGRLAKQVGKLQERVDALEALLNAGTPGPVEVSVPQQLPPVESVPQDTIPDAGGQKQGRPKNRYQVEGERGNWGIRDSETGLYVVEVQRLRKDADRMARDLNSGAAIPDPFFVPPNTPLQREAEASVALDKDPDCGTQSIEAQQVETSGGKMYQPHEEKPAPKDRPDRESSVSPVGRVPWYAK